MTEPIRTKVAIIGAGPAGSLLSILLHRHGVDSVVLERQSRDHVLGRTRAGVLEWTSVGVLRDAGLAAGMDRAGHVHDTIKLGWRGRNLLTIDLHELSGQPMMAYGQTRLQHDLYVAAAELDLAFVFEVGGVDLAGLDSGRPRVRFTADGSDQVIECEFVVGCDGFHGVTRHGIPRGRRQVYQVEYPFGWLGIISETPPLPTLVYSNHSRGFALCSQRSPRLSRYYVQCPLEDDIADWPDDRFWDELLTRVPDHESDAIVTGPSIEKSIAPVRSYMATPMQWERLFLAGDAAHVMPPTGAKGLNLAISDAHYLATALVGQILDGDGSHLVGYTDTASRRVWSAVRFSWWMTRLLHRFPHQTDFDQRMQEEDLAYLARSESARASLAEQYVGLPL